MNNIGTMGLVPEKFLSEWLNIYELEVIYRPWFLVRIHIHWWHSPSIWYSELWYPKRMPKSSGILVYRGSRVYWSFTEFSFLPKWVGWEEDTARFSICGTSKALRHASSLLSDSLVLKRIQNHRLWEPEESLDITGPAFLFCWWGKWDLGK